MVIRVFERIDVDADRLVGDLIGLVYLAFDDRFSRGLARELWCLSGLCRLVRLRGRFDFGLTKGPLQFVE